MTILLPALAVAFAAFCVWLTVRIVNRRERWAKWTLAAILIGAPFIYVGSVAPISLLTLKTGDRYDIYVAEVPRVYWPLGRLARSSTWANLRLMKYFGVVAPKHAITTFCVPANPSGNLDTVYYSCERRSKRTIFSPSDVK